MMIYEPGDLPVAGTGTEVPDHEELVVPFTYLLNLFHHSFYCGRRFFYVKGEIVPVNMTVFLSFGEVFTSGDIPAIWFWFRIQNIILIFNQGGKQE